MSNPRSLPSRQQGCRRWGLRRAFSAVENFFGRQLPSNNKKARVLSGSILLSIGGIRT